MSIHSSNSTDTARKSAIVELLAGAASENGAQVIAVGGSFKGPLSAYHIASALSIRSEEAHRLINELVDASTIVRVTGGSENAMDWKYAAA